MRLRPVGLHDWQFLYDLLKERPEHANISHREMPSVSDHIAFLRSNPYAAWYILEQDNKPIGSAYLSHNNEIGIAIKSEYQRQGLAKTAIEELMRQHPKPRYLANISPLNAESTKLFMQLGFNHIQNTFEMCS